jgi:hypothetical protein
MSKRADLELASMVLGPFDNEWEFALYTGYVLNERFIFIVDDSQLWLRHVHKTNMGHLYVDGESGGMVIANVEGDGRALIDIIIERLQGMSALEFLLETLLWTPERGDINLKLERLR